MSALLDALAPAVGGRLERDRVALHRNAGPVPPPRGTPEDHVSTRGFNLQVLGTDGRTTHYVKCRHRASTRARREADAFVALGSDPRTKAHVPAATVVEVGDVLALVTGFQQGATLHASARRLGRERVRAVAEEVLRLSGEVAAVLSAGAPSSGADPLGEREAVRRALGGAGVGPDALERLERRAAALPGLAASPQHGDLTARNVLLVDGRPVLLDFEAFGETRMPLFDAWSLVRSLPAGGRVERALPWWKRPVAGLVTRRAATLGLDRDGAVTLLAWFLASSATRLLHRDVPAAFVTPYLRELELALREGAATLGR
ncbi:MAG TPA: phosphotransferase [Longimicrobiales bacterium]|nr:phosphotransferase [Longimicrobiales bacterium]